MTREQSNTIVKSLGVFAIAFMVVFGVLLLLGGFKPGPAIITPDRHFPAVEQEQIFYKAEGFFMQKNAYTSGMLGPSHPIRAGLGINGWIWVGTSPLDATVKVANYLVNVTGFNLTAQCLLLFENIARTSYPLGFNPVTGTWGSTETNHVVTRLGMYRGNTGSSWILFDATTLDDAALVDFPTLTVYHLRA